MVSYGGWPLLEWRHSLAGRLFHSRLSPDHLTHVASGLGAQGVQKDPRGAVTGVTVKLAPGRKATDTFLKLTWLADVRRPPPPPPSRAPPTARPCPPAAIHA